MGLNLQSVSVLAELERYGLQYQSAGGDEVKVCCPFHKDGKESNPSCLVNVQKREFKCHTAGCESSGDIISLLSRSAKQPRATVLTDLAQRYDIEDDKTLDPVAIERWHDAIWQADALRGELYTRGVTDDMIRAYRLGVVESRGIMRITIPIKNRSGSFVNVRKYLPGAPGPEKMKNTSGYGKVRWHPIEQLKYDEILVVGGECKAYVAIAELNKYGIGVVTPTCGEGNIPVELLMDLKGKSRVYVCMDIDAAGIRASKSHATAIKMVAHFVATIQLPLDEDKYPKGDINDYLYTEKGLLKPLIDAATEFVPNYVDRLEPDETPPKELSLVTAIHAENSGKRIRVKGVVSMMDTTPYLVPERITIHCSKDQPYCAICPVFVKGRDEYTIPAESPSLLEFINSHKSRHLEIVKQTIGIPQVCRVCEFEKLSEYNIEDSRISPQLELTSRFGDRQPVPAYCVGTGLSLNEAYEFTGKLVAHPSTQQATLLISQYQAAKDALSTYTITEAGALGVFWPDEWSVAGIDRKLRHIYSDFAYNVTGIRGRQNLHLAVDLCYHSPLLINIDGEDANGWVDVLIIGDSANGKSKCIQMIQAHYNLGQIVECSNSSAAGIFGGMEKMGERHFVSWGIIPHNDQRQVTLEEFKDAPKDLAIRLRDGRTRGIAEIAKIGNKHKTLSRVRLLVVTNPESGNTIASYSYGILTVKELFPTDADSRRFDFCLITSSFDTPPKEPIEHIYTADLCQELVLWAWTRTREQVQFTPEATELIIAEAKALTQEYSEIIPIVDKGSMHCKVARLSAALAARLFSCSDDYQNLIIYPCHVEYIVNFIRATYNDTAFGYQEFSKAQLVASTLLDPELLVAAIKATPHPKEFCRSMLAQDYIEHQDFAAWAALDMQSAIQMLSLFVRKHGLQRRAKYFRKSSLLIDLLKKVEADEALPEVPQVQPVSEKRF